MKFQVEEELIQSIRVNVVVPLKDAMELKSYKEHKRNKDFYRFDPRSAKTVFYGSYTFVLEGVLKHEMYLKAIHPPRIKKLLSRKYGYKLIITPNKKIDLDFAVNNKRKIELVIYYKNKRRIN